MSSKFDFDEKTHGFSEFNDQSIKFEVFLIHYIWVQINTSLYVPNCLYLFEIKFEFSQEKPIRYSSLFEK